MAFVSLAKRAEREACRQVLTVENWEQKERHRPLVYASLFGAGDRGRTDTVSLPLDFESSTSAKSITPACVTSTLLFYRIFALLSSGF